MGYKAGFYETENNKLYINNDSSTSPLIYGDFANDSVKINGKLEVTGNAKMNSVTIGVSGVTISDIVKIEGDFSGSSLNIDYHAEFNNNNTHVLSFEVLYHSTD